MESDIVEGKGAAARQGLEVQKRGGSHFTNVKQRAEGEWLALREDAQTSRGIRHATFP